MEIYSKTDIGKVRTSNQDAVMVKKVSENFVSQRKEGDDEEKVTAFS